MYTNKLSKETQIKKFAVSNGGFGMIQVLAGMSFMFLLIYGVMTMLENSSKAQRIQTLRTNFADLQIKVRNILMDRDSWDKTLNAPGNSAAAEMNCLANHTNCTAAIRNIKSLVDANGTALGVNFPIWSAPAYGLGTTSGFTENGSPCVGFNGTAGAGSDACPISYSMVWQPYTAGVDPGIRITARFLYNPATVFLAQIPILRGTFTGAPATDLLTLASDNSTKKAVHPRVASDIDPSREVFDANLGKYDVVVWRSATTNVQSFRVTSTTSGVCGNVFATRGSMTEQSDPFDLINITSGDTITFKRTGTYECDIAVNGNGVNSFQAKLTRISGGPVTDFGSGASVAPVGSQATLEFSTSFTLINEAGSDFRISQSCETSSSVEDFGSTYGAPVLLSLFCKLVD